MRRGEAIVQDCLRCGRRRVVAHGRDNDYCQDCARFRPADPAPDDALPPGHWYRNRRGVLSYRVDVEYTDAGRHQLALIDAITRQSEREVA